MSLSPFVKEVVEEWETLLQASEAENLADSPNYYAREPRRDLLTTCNPTHFSLGTGHQLYNEITSHILRSVRHELLIVTCFWASSPTSQVLAYTLRQLSRKAASIGSGHRIRVRICLSSLSLSQKLFHTTSLTGQTYGPETWAPLFGLPPPCEVRHLDIEIKSVFVYPFSVMHPKSVILDRTQACILSANVSWEDWFEGCVWFEGDMVDRLVKFWTEFWAGEGSGGMPGIFDFERTTSESVAGDMVPSSEVGTEIESRKPIRSVDIQGEETNALLLPSPHHRNPRFRPFLSAPSPPSTPLNVFLLTIFSRARQSITLQTPNLTAAPVQLALLDALSRGVNVQITISSRLMVLEQLVTAGQTSEIAVASLKRRHAKLLAKTNNTDLEANTTQPGDLNVRWYTPSSLAEGEPVKSHLKLSAVDGEVAVLGSGNLDRASWYTSQELGIALFGESVVKQITESVELAMEGRFVCD